MKKAIAGLTFMLSFCVVTTHSGGFLKVPQKPMTSMICGTTGAQALQGGLDILKNGGNAMDAALSTSLSQVALAAGS
ncbi:MAG: hypothetical protein ABIP28_07415, partial [Mucilaginibacter sp.]